MSSPTEPTSSDQTLASLTVTGNSIFDTTTTNDASRFNGAATFSDGISVTNGTNTDNLTVLGDSTFNTTTTNVSSVFNGLVTINGTSTTTTANITTLNVTTGSVLNGGATVDILDVSGNSTFANTITNGTTTLNTIEVNNASTFTGEATFTGEITATELTINSYAANSLTTDSLTIGSTITLPTTSTVRPNTDLTQIGSLITITNYIIGLVPYSAYGSYYSAESIDAGAGINTTSPPYTTPMYSTLIQPTNYSNAGTEYPNQPYPTGSLPAPNPISTPGFISYNNAQLLTSVQFGNSAYPFGTYMFIATYAYIPQYQPIDIYGSYISTYLWSNIANTGTSTNYNTVNSNSFTAKNNYLAASNLINSVSNILTGTFYCVVPIYEPQTISLSVFNYLWAGDNAVNAVAAANAANGTTTSTDGFNGTGVYMLTCTLDGNTGLLVTPNGATTGDMSSGSNNNPYINSSQPTTLQVIRIA